jgi:hypothetical protein
MLDVRQAEQLVYAAAEAIPDTERRIEQQENFISTLLARTPKPSPGESNLLNSRTPWRFPPGFRPLSWKVAPTFARRNSNWPQPTPRLGLPKQTSFRKFH